MNLDDRTFENDRSPTSPIRFSCSEHPAIFYDF